MAWWHEQIPYLGFHAMRLAAPHEQWSALISRVSSCPEQFEIVFRYRKSKATPTTPPRWDELRPDPPLRFVTGREACEYADKELPHVAAGTTNLPLQRAPYVPPPPPISVWKTLHPSGNAKAIVLQHAPNRFEVRYFAQGAFDKAEEDEEDSEEFGRVFVPDTPRRMGDGASVYGYETGTFADGLEDAQTVALVELEKVAKVKPVKVNDE